MSSSSTQSHSPSNDHFSFLPPLIVYDLQASIPKTDPYSIFRSNSTSLFHDQSSHQLIREEDPEDPLSPVPTHRREAAEHQPNGHQFGPNKVSSTPSTSGSHFSDDSDSDSDSREDGSESSSIRDGFEYDQVPLASPSTLDPVYLSSPNTDFMDKISAEHSESGVRSPTSRRGESQEIEETDRDLGLAHPLSTRPSHHDNQPPFLNRRPTSRRSTKGSVHNLTIEETRIMLENAWREEQEGQKLHEIQLAESRRMEQDKKELAKSSEEARSGQDQLISRRDNFHHKRGSKSLDSATLNNRFKPHALHHITRIVPPQPLASTSSSSNQRSGHRHTSSLPQDGAMARNWDLQQELRCDSRETIPLAAFDHTLPSPRNELVMNSLREPSYLALPEPQSKASAHPSDKTTSDYEIRWDLNLPGFKLWKEESLSTMGNRQQLKLVGRIPKQIKGWKMVLIEPKDENLVRREVVDSRRDVGKIICEARRSGNKVNIKGRDSVASTLSTKGFKDQKSFLFFAPDGQLLSWSQCSNSEKAFVLKTQEGGALAFFKPCDEKAATDSHEIGIGRLQLILDSSSSSSSQDSLPRDSDGIHGSNLDLSHRHFKVKNADLVPNPTSNLPKIIESSETFVQSSTSRFGMELKDTLFKDSIINSSSLSKSNDLIPNSKNEISYELIVATLFIVLSNKGLVSKFHLNKNLKEKVLGAIL